MDADIAERGLVLVGCGRMGSALLSGWLSRGLPADAATVIEPSPSEWLRGTGIRLADALPWGAAAIVIAVKPQMMPATLPGIAAAGGAGTLVISVAAGVTLAAFEAAFGARTPIVRAMPNTPAAIGAGITALAGNAAATEAHMARAEMLLGAVGQTVRLDDEAAMDAVTAVSGSGPAYVFHMIEALAAAGEAEGLPPALAMQLARATVSGAGALAEREAGSVAALREAVTSPGGTTAAALAVLMDAETGLAPLMRATVAAAAARSRELGR